MRMAFYGGELKGTLNTPPSKSYTHRAFFLASMAKGRSTIFNALLSEDTRATLDICGSMGAKIAINGDYNTGDGQTVVIDGGDLHAPTKRIDTKNSGTTMRIFTGLASIFDTEIEITGDESLQKRPMGPLLEALEQVGVKCTSKNGLPPLTIKGPNNGGVLNIDGGMSSQYITSLLMTAPMLRNDSTIKVRGKMVSEPYLDVTTSMMRKFGAHLKKNDGMFTIHGNSGYTASDYRVPSDFSSAAFSLVAGALGGEVSVLDLDFNDPQGDRRIVDILKMCGADVKINGTTVTVSRGQINALDIDMSNIPDLFPIVAVLLSTANGTSRLYGAPQLKLKESNRIESTVNMLNAIGAYAEATDDGCIIQGKQRLVGGTVDNMNDHRIMMSAAVASVRCDGPVIMDNAECHVISYPDFPKDMMKLGMRVE